VEEKKNILTKIQSFSESRKKLIVVVIVLVLAVPLSVFVLQDVKKAIEEFDEAKIEEGLNIKELKQKIEESTADLGEGFKSLKIATSTLELNTTSSATSTFSEDIATSSNSQ
jgi:predicted Holliday junction resolvase-like endonuclease